MSRAGRMPNWRRQRSLFPVLGDGLYVDHASRGPLSTRVVEALGRWAEDAARPGEGRPGDADLEKRVRAAGAALLRADPSDLAFVSSAHHGFSMLLGGLDWRAGDQLVYATPALPPSTLPWADRFAAKQVEAIQLMLPSASDPGAPPPREIAARTLELVEKSLTGVRTRMLLLPAVSPHDGARLDLAAIGSLCRDRGALLAVDASLALGALPLAPSQMGVDFLVADGHRWLGSIQGSGLLYCNAGVADCVHAPQAEGSGSSDARRFEVPQPSAAGIASLGAALGLVNELGIEAIGERILELGAYLAHGAEALGFAVRSPSLSAGASGLVCFAGSERWTAPLLHSRLASQGVQVGLARRPQLRDCEVPAPAHLVAASPHFYNDQEDLDRLLEALQN